jgi:hypothetical protein
MACCRPENPEGPSPSSNLQDPIRRESIVVHVGYSSPSVTEGASRMSLSVGVGRTLTRRRVMADHDVHRLVDQADPTIATWLVGNLQSNETTCHCHEQVERALTTQSGGFRELAGVLESGEADGQGFW